MQSRRRRISNNDPERIRRSHEGQTTRSFYLINSFLTDSKNELTLAIFAERMDRISSEISFGKNSTNPAKDIDKPGFTPVPEWDCSRDKDLRSARFQFYVESRSSRTFRRGRTATPECPLLPTCKRITGMVSSCPLEFLQGCTHKGTRRRGRSAVSVGGPAGAVVVALLPAKAVFVAEAKEAILFPRTYTRRVCR